MTEVYPIGDGGAQVSIAAFARTPGMVDTAMDWRFAHARIATTHGPELMPQTA